MNAQNQYPKLSLKLIERVVDGDKLDILQNCAIGFCRHPYRLRDLAKEFRDAKCEGFTVMRIVGSLVLLMFVDMSMRKKRVWLSACGILIHSWYEGTFKNIAVIWGDLVQVDPRTLAHPSFERSRFQVESDWLIQIDEKIDLQIGDKVFPVRVVEMEEAVSPKCDCCCGIDVGSTGEDTDVTSSSGCKEVDELKIMISEVVATNSLNDTVVGDTFNDNIMDITVLAKSTIILTPDSSHL
ncbi:hypothetical protein V6N11_063211 [Hibiscus sabdariffa]|uniref:DUF4283 domain-containing protein n=1 Tax=Hibiscus sabdariffa TaxID=183260 RepID=A0ABR2NWZ8_9ROSI